MATLTVRKTRLAEAVQINTPQDEKTVRRWISEYAEDPDAGETADLEELKSQHVYFMRDLGSPIIYITASADFLNFFEEVNEAEEDHGFTFDD